MVGPFEPLRRVFGPEDLRAELIAAGVTGTILVQTMSSLDETVSFLEIADRTDFVGGVIGWADLTSPAFGDDLQRLSDRPDGRWLVGLRHQVHDETDPRWLLRGDVRRGLAEIGRRGLAYDLLIRPRELPAALQTVADFPEIRFVIDHIAKPDIAGGAFATWAERMEAFGPHRSHVWCKLSGMITEARWTSWSHADIAPYAQHMLDIFGADRCMFGSDWPVCLLAGEYARVLELVDRCTAELAPEERAWIFSGSAIEAYRLAF